MTQFGRFPEKVPQKIGAEAVVEALKDAGIKWRQIPMMYCTHSSGGNTDGQLIEAELGHIGIPIVNVANACAGGSTSVLLAYQAVATGLYDLIMTVGVDQAPYGPLGGAFPPDPLTVMGVSNMLAKYAMKMQRAIYEKRYTLDQMAWCSVKNHNNGCLNPRAQYKIPMKGPEAVHNSRMVADPMTLYHCCPTGDGAAAAILCTQKVARKYSRGPLIKIVGGALTSQIFIRGELADTRDVSVRAAKQAYEITGIEPKDVDMVELHDNFTVSELEHIVDLQLCEEDEVGPLMERGHFNLNGPLPVNPSGGLIAKGHPASATGVAQIAEFVWQMRGQAGQRQLKSPKIGLSHLCGGDEGMATTVIITKR
jgi:benzoylsuccinyl-CoA thiolase BbsB subunit